MSTSSSQSSSIGKPKMLSFNFGGQPAQTKRTSFKLRTYQQEAIDAANKKFADGARSLLMVLPTGAGKTICLSHMCRQRMDVGRSMILVHRDELIRQAAQKIEDICGVKPGIDKAEERSTAQMECGVPFCTVVYRGPYDRATIAEIAETDSRHGKARGHLMEGVVIVPAVERRDDRIGRVALKLISNRYWLS